MKKIKVLLATVILTGLTLASCSSDDDGGGTSASIVAKWTPTKTIYKVNNQTVLNQPYEDNEPGCDKDYFEFTANGAINKVVYFHNAENTCEASTGNTTSYTKSDNNLTIAGGEYAGTYKIIKLSGSDLQVSVTETEQGITSVTTLYFTKVN